MKEPAVRHLDARSLGHQVVCKLDASVVLAAPELAVGAHAVELQQPVVESRWRGDLPRADLVGLRVPDDDGLRARAAGGRADFDDAAQRRVRVVIAVPVARDRQTSLRDELAHLDRRRLLGGRAARRAELQGTHATRRHVREPVERGDLCLTQTLVGHVAVDERIAEIVG